MSNLQLDPIHLQAVSVAVKAFDYGDLIPMKWLYSNFEVILPDKGTKKEFEQCMFDFLSCMERFKDVMLKEHNMMLINVRGNGYLIVKPEHQVGLTMSRFKDKIRKETKRAVESLSYINETLIAQDEIKRRDESLGKLAAMSAFTKNRLGC